MTLPPIHLFQETAGPCIGAVYAVSGERGHSVWSPRWRSEVAEHERCTHLGIIGAATCLGWSEAAGTAPTMQAPRALGETGPSQAEIEAVLVAAGVKVRPLATPAPAARRG